MKRKQQNMETALMTQKRRKRGVLCTTPLSKLESAVSMHYLCGFLDCASALQLLVSSPHLNECMNGYVNSRLWWTEKAVSGVICRSPQAYPRVFPQLAFVTRYEIIAWTNVCQQNTYLGAGFLPNCTVFRMKFKPNPTTTESVQQKAMIAKFPVLPAYINRLVIVNLNSTWFSEPIGPPGSMPLKFGFRLHNNLVERPAHCTPPQIVVLDFLYSPLFNECFKVGFLHQNLRQLRLGQHYNQPFLPNALPRRLTVLSLGQFYARRLTCENMPLTLRHLQVSDSLLRARIDNEVFHSVLFLPPTLKTLIVNVFREPEIHTSNCQCAQHEHDQLCGLGWLQEKFPLLMLSPLLPPNLRSITIRFQFSSWPHIQKCYEATGTNFLWNQISKFMCDRYSQLSYTPMQTPLSNSLVFVNKNIT